MQTVKIQKKTWKQQHLLNDVKVFTAIFDRFKVSLLDKSIHLFLKT